jgi:hypothetical protein
MGNGDVGLGRKVWVFRDCAKTKFFRGTELPRSVHSFSIKMLNSIHWESSLFSDRVSDAFINICLKSIWLGPIQRDFIRNVVVSVGCSELRSSKPTSKHTTITATKPPAAADSTNTNAQNHQSPCRGKH